MARMRLEVGLRSQGASLRTIGRELRDMNNAQVTRLFRRHLEDAAAPFVPRVRASVMAIPVGSGPQSGLRARIAACASVSSWTDARSAGAAVFMDTSKMPPGERSLPLGMEGAKRWRHPVFARPGTSRAEQTWVTEPPHPYFYQAVEGLGRASGDALKAALEDITRKING